jgi:hypothetical protein
MNYKVIAFTAFLGFSVLLVGCQQSGVPKEALMPTYVTTEQRSLQTRYFDTLKEGDLLAASAAVLQDLGFTLDESETKLGLLTASKARDARESSQIAGAVVMAVLFGAQVATDKDQKIRVSVVTKKKPDSEKQMSVRVTFQRLIWNDRGVLWKMETINDAEQYQGFFERLSKAVFLEAHNQ